MHSEFSYDTGAGCLDARGLPQAVDLGLPSIAFTEHLEILEAGPGDLLAVLDRDRRLRATGSAAGRRGLPRRHRGVPGEVPVPARPVRGRGRPAAPVRGERWLAVLGGGRFDRVLGSCHALVHDGELIEADELFDRCP